MCGEPRTPFTGKHGNLYDESTGLILPGLSTLHVANVEGYRACRRFADEYNWVRPHEALGGGVPGASCEPSPRKRPARMPGHEIAEGAETRKVDSDGFISYKGQPVRLGKGLIGERVVLEEEGGEIFLFFAGYRLCRLKDLPR